MKRATIVFVLALSGCDGDGDGGFARADLMADCFQTARDLGAFHGKIAAVTVSSRKPYEWWFGRTGVDATGLVFTEAPAGAATVTMGDGTVHLVNRHAATAWDGALGLYAYFALPDAGGAVLRRSDDAGGAWHDLTLPFAVTDAGTAPPPVAAHQDRVLAWDNRLDFAAEGRAVISDDRGGQWRRLAYPDIGPQFRVNFRSAAIGTAGKVAVTLETDIDGNEANVWATTDDGAHWARIFDARDVMVQVANATDGVLWIADQHHLFRSPGWDGGISGGTIGTTINGTTERDGVRPLWPDAPLFAQPGGRMGFRMVQGAPPGTTASRAIGYGYCVHGPATTGEVVPVIDPSPAGVVVGTTPGRVEVAKTFPSPDHRFAIDASGAIVSAKVSGSYDTTLSMVQRDGEDWLDTRVTMPPGSRPGLTPIDVAVAPDSDKILLLVGPTKFSEATHPTEVDLPGAVWELTRAGALTGRAWNIGSEPDGDMEFPTSLFAGPQGGMLVRTRRGVFQVGPAVLPAVSLGTGGEMAFDPVSGAVFYQDGQWVARAGAAADVFKGRCDAATADTFDCLGLGGDVVLGAIAVGHDGYLYVAIQLRPDVVRRPIDTPATSWEPVITGTSGGVHELVLDRHEGRTRIWALDGETLWVGVIGDSLPLTR